MSVHLDALMGRTYDREAYNCAHFAAEAWRLETGEDLLPLLVPLMHTGSDGRAWRALGQKFERHDGTPENGRRALVLMRRAGCASHMGLLLRGRVLHLHERGPERLPPSVACRGFDAVTYYTRKGAQPDADSHTV